MDGVVVHQNGHAGRADKVLWASDRLRDLARKGRRRRAAYFAHTARDQVACNLADSLRRVSACIFASTCILSTWRPLPQMLADPISPTMLATITVMPRRVVAGERDHAIVGVADARVRSSQS